jgi:Heme/copper-type cytochrome/quinol oxidases, subunit 1
VFATEYRLTGLNLLIAFIALAIGGLFGVMQALQYNGIDLYKPIAPVLRGGYYQGLALHGVLNVLVFTTFFIIGWLTFVTSRSLGIPLASRALGWTTFGVMTAGLLIAALPLLLNNATVLFTFYPPLKADPLFYIGLTLVVVGTWLLLINQVMMLRQWRAANPAARIPLPAFMAIVTMTMWVICTFGVATEMLFLLIPWSLGLVQGTDPVLARTLFWFTGHPDRLLLAAASVHFVVQLRAAAGGRQVVQRSDGAGVVHSVPDPFDADRDASPVHRSGHQRDLETGARNLHLWRLFPQPVDLLQRCGVA